MNNTPHNISRIYPFVNAHTYKYMLICMYLHDTYTAYSLSMTLHIPLTLTHTAYSYTYRLLLHIPLTLTYTAYSYTYRLLLRIPLTLTHTAYSYISTAYSRINQASTRCINLLVCTCTCINTHTHTHMYMAGGGTARIRHAQVRGRTIECARDLVTTCRVHASSS
jgi:hypothetical protein